MSRRIPSLDGLRAASVALVMFGHLAGTRGFVPRAAVASLGDLANLGVRTFFVISGFLITHLLLAEQEQTGTISLRAFYVRRVFRIFPAFYAFTALVALLACSGSIDLRARDLLHALTFTMNFHQDRAWYVGHLWSLSVEEQFYALWPCALLLLGASRAAGAAALAIVAAPVVRVVCFAFFPDLRAGIGETFPTIMDAIAVGCLLALWRTRLHRSEIYRRLFTPRALCLTVVAIFGTNLLHPHVRFSLAVGETVLNVAIAVVVDRVMTMPTDWLGRVLNFGPVAFVGTLSYSMYLWQQLFLNRTSTGALAAFPLNVLLVIAAALASYYGVERPLLALRAQAGRSRPERGRTTAAQFLREAAQP